MPRLRVLRGPEPGVEYSLEDDVMTIGRGRKNHIIIQDNEVSRVHCRLVRVLEDYEIHDNGSTNGTFVNGQRLTDSGWLLSPHAIVELGDSITLEYLIEEMATGPSPAVRETLVETEEIYYLVVKQNSLPQPEVYLLDRLTVSVGRDTDNDIVLQEPDVSRHHLRMILSETGYIVEDLNTMNGSFINDRRLSQQRSVRITDVIRIGEGTQMWLTTDPEQLLDSLKRGESIAAVKSNSGDSTIVDDRPTDEIAMPEETIAIRPENTTGMLEASVLMAYSPDDWSALVSRLEQFLVKNGILVWSAEDGDPERAEWIAAIEQAQTVTPCLLVVLSEKSLNTPYVQRSIRYFVSREKPVILLQYGTINRMPMAIENMAKIKIDYKNPMQAFHEVLGEIHKLNLMGR